MRAALSSLGRRLASFTSTPYASTTVRVVRENRSVLTALVLSASVAGGAASSCSDVSEAPTVVAAASAVAREPRHDDDQSVTSMPAAIARVLPSTFRVEILSSSRSRPGIVGAGTGFIIAEDGTALTAAHVIAPAMSLRTAAMLRCSFADGRAFEAEVVGMDPAADVAVLRLRPFHEGERFVPATLGRGRAMRLGEPLAAVGAGHAGRITALPGAVADRSYMSDIPNLHVPPNLEGIEFIQVSVPVLRGNSGGPIVNHRGEVVSMVVLSAGMVDFATLSSEHRYYSIIIEDAAAIAEQIRSSGAESLRRPRLGLAVESVNRLEWEWMRLAADLPADCPVALVVRGVRIGSPAERAGMMPGDVVIKCNGVPVTGKGALYGALGPLYHEGAVVELTVLRGAFDVSSSTHRPASPKGPGGQIITIRITPEGEPVGYAPFALQ